MTRTPDETLPSSADWTQPRPREPTTSATACAGGPAPAGSATLWACLERSPGRPRNRTRPPAPRTLFGDQPRRLHILPVELLRRLPDRAGETLDVGVEQELRERVPHMGDHRRAGPSRRPAQRMAASASSEPSYPIRIGRRVLHLVQATGAPRPQLPDDPRGALRANYLRKTAPHNRRASQASGLRSETPAERRRSPSNSTAVPPAAHATSEPRRCPIMAPALIVPRSRGLAYSACTRRPWRRNRGYRHVARSRHHRAGDGSRPPPCAGPARSGGAAGRGTRRAAGQAGCGMLASTASPLGALSISPSCNAR